MPRHLPFTMLFATCLMPLSGNADTTVLSFTDDLRTNANFVTCSSGCARVFEQRRRLCSMGQECFC